MHTDFATPQEVADASGRNESAFGVTIDPLGRIIAVGQREAAPVVDFAVARYLPDGTLDGSFGSGGTLRIDTGSSDSANEVVVDGNGKIVFVGRGASIVRLNDDGSFDTSFGGGDGVVSGSFFEFLDVVLQDDGKLITSGRNGHAGVFRFNTDGSLDTTFGTAGGVSVDISGRGNDTARGVALQADGKMVFVGVAPNEDDPAPQNIIGLARLLGDNIPPTINGLNFDVVENLSSIGMVTAADDDLPEDALTFSITGDGADDPLFTITADGALSFLAAPDYENPLDVNGDNTYEVEVRVTDNVGASAVATMTVNVLNQIATISGTVFVDVDGDGLFDGGTETALDGVTVELLDSANSVLATDVTELGGVYAFTVDNELGTYRIRESQPTGVDDGAAILGNAGGTVISSNEMEVTLVGDDASDYDFTEVGQAIQAGDTATIGFWQNKHGQSMISQGGPALVSWLNANFGNIFGSTLTDGSGGDDAAEVASFYKNEFFKKKLTGTSKVDAQFMATALATFFTSSDLSGGNVAAGYGFNVTETGIGTKVLNVGTNGAAFGVVDNTNMTIMSLLLATNSLTDNDGVLNNDNDGYSHVYDVDGDGDLDEYELSLRAMANTIYSTINEQGDI
ncbi:MAG: SdrD B-like domain-containing protein [Planctomycetaceae bacterium]